jgi:spermidine synthase
MKKMPPRSGNIIVSEYFDDHLVEIVDEDDHRSLYFADSILQSRISFIAPDSLILLYTQYMMSALLVQPEPQHVLLIGIGAGALVRFLHHHFPHCAIDAVDHSDQIIKIAVGYFQMPNKDPITIYCCDGYEFLAAKKPERPYDLILIDAFDEKGMSKTIYTGDFFRLCMESLIPEGVLSCNLWSGDLEELTEVKNSIQRYATSHLYLPVPNRGNIIALAFNTPAPWRKINRPENELHSLSQYFHIDLDRIVSIAKRFNMTVGQRISSIFL